MCSSSWREKTSRLRAQEQELVKAGKAVNATLLQTVRGELCRIEYFITRKPPFYWPAEYWEPDLSKSGCNFMHTLNPNVTSQNMHTVVPFMERLSRGEAMSIIILGGSFANGEECVQGGFRQHDCAWSRRFVAWLHVRFPSAEISFYNMALNGCPSSCLLSTVGLELNVVVGSVDLVIVDTSSNDQCGDHHEKDGHEKLLRAVKFLAPESLVFGMLSYDDLGCQKHPLVDLWEYYGLPHVLIPPVSRVEKSLWQPPYHHHPHWTTHQHIANIMAHAWGWAWRSYAPKWDQPATNPQGNFDVNRTCLEPTTVYSGYARHGGISPEAVSGNWRLFEDRPGKPGWIATEVGSMLRFRFNLSGYHEHRFVIKYLRSYQSLGNVYMTWHGEHIGSDQRTLQGLWAEKTHPRVSQTDVSFEAVKMLPKYPRETLFTLDVKFLGPGKFKLISALSC